MWNFVSPSWAHRNSPHFLLRKLVIDGYRSNDDEAWDLLVGRWCCQRTIPSFIGISNCQGWLLSLGLPWQTSKCHQPRIHLAICLDNVLVKEMCPITFNGGYDSSLPSNIHTDLWDWIHQQLLQLMKFPWKMWRVSSLLLMVKYIQILKLPDVNHRLWPFRGQDPHIPQSGWNQPSWILLSFTLQDGPFTWNLRFLMAYTSSWVNFITPNPVLPKPRIMVSKGNHPQMALIQVSEIL